MAEGGSLEIESYRIRFVDKIGQGAFGAVYMGKHLVKGDKVAVKQCKLQSDKHGSMAMKEIKNLKQLEKHPNIVNLIDFHFSENSFWMIMEFRDAGDLEHFIKNVNPDLETKVNIMYQCACGIAFMHSRPNPVIHRDIKPANILMKTECGKVVVKLADFGISKVVEGNPDPAITVMLTTAVGTPGFMAPEFFLREPYTSSVDVFALGLVYLSLLDYKPGDTALIPLSASKKKQKMIMPVGMEMAQLHTMGMPQPELTADSSDDTPQIKQVKKLVNSMSVFDRKQRMVMHKVEAELQKLEGGVLANANTEAHELYKIPEIPRLQIDEAPPILQKANIVARPIEEEQWFHGVLPREGVDWLLKENGDYLLRESKPKKSSGVHYVLSVMWNEMRHFIIRVSESAMSIPHKKPLNKGLLLLGCEDLVDSQEDQWWFEGNTFNSIQELISDQQSSGEPVTKRSQAILKRAILRESWELSHHGSDEIIVGRKLGDGYFGDVLMGTFKGTEVVVKRCKHTLTNNEKKDFFQESYMLKQYDHPNIVRFIGIAAEREPVMMVLEYVAGGELLSFLRSEGKKSVSKICAKTMMKICTGAAAGMAYLEERGSIHRDLAARNCLVGKDNVVKIAHFREACEQREYTVPGGLKQIPIKWTAPEALNFGTYTSACDVWSFGILVWEVFSFGATPYPEFTNNQARERVDEGYRMARPEMAPKEVYDLMLKCWEAEPKDRLTFDEIHAELLRLRKIIS